METAQESDKCFARRLENRPAGAELGKGVMHLLPLVFVWALQDHQTGFVEQIEFACCGLDVLFFFGLPSLLDTFAKRAGMIAVEGVLDSLAEVRVSNVDDYHCCPSHGLEHRPMPAYCNRQHGDQHVVCDFCKNSIHDAAQ